MVVYHHSLYTTIPSVGIDNPNKGRNTIEYETDRADNERKEHERNPGPSGTNPTHPILGLLHFLYSIENSSSRRHGRLSNKIRSKDYNLVTLQVLPVISGF